MRTASGWPTRAPAKRVSMKVVMLAPRMYGTTFSRLTYPRAARGTRREMDTETDMVTAVTASPMANMKAGR